MKNRISVLLTAIVLASCSAPKYAYYFDHQNNYAGKKQSAASVQETLPLSVDPMTLVASISSEPIVMTEASPETWVAAEQFKNAYLQMNKSERKTLRHQIKKEVKVYKHTQEDSVQATKAGMDHDLKLAIIFGAVGLVALLIGTSPFWVIGAIALLIGVVFFVKWIIRQ